MLKKFTYPALLALWMLIAVACHKETVKPFNPTNGSNYTVPDTRDGEGGGSTEDPNTPDPVTTDSTNTTGSGSGSDEDEGITDGGGSSEQDSKSKRKKP